MNTTIMHEVLKQSVAGELTFPEVVRRLMEVGVESYFVDFASVKESLYLSNGAAYEEKMALPATKIAEEFSAAGIVAAIRHAQADQIRYPEFVKQATTAGVIGYWAFLTGRKVIYFGRTGEFHVEEFPRAKP